jgi:hypothetical protein
MKYIMPCSTQSGVRQDLLNGEHLNCIDQTIPDEC